MMLREHARWVCVMRAWDAVAMVTVVSVVNGVSSMWDDAPSIDFAPHAGVGAAQHSSTTRTHALYEYNTNETSSRYLQFHNKQPKT